MLLFLASEVDRNERVFDMQRLTKFAALVPKVLDFAIDVVAELASGDKDRRAVALGLRPARASSL